MDDFEIACCNKEEDYQFRFNALLPEKPGPLTRLSSKCIFLYNHIFVIQ